MALTRFGRAYGNLRKNSISPNVSGYDPAGSDKIPPRIGPMITPMLKHIGRRMKARAWYFFSRTVSLILLRHIGQPRQVLSPDWFFTLSSSLQHYHL